MIRFSDDTTTACYLQPPTYHPELRTFKHDEYAVYDQSKVKLRFVLVFRKGDHPLLERPKLINVVTEELNAHATYVSLLRAASAQRGFYEQKGDKEAAERSQCQLLKRYL